MRCDHLNSLPSSSHLLSPELPPTDSPSFFSAFYFSLIFGADLVHISHSCSAAVVATAASYLEDRVSSDSLHPAPIIFLPPLPRFPCILDVKRMPGAEHLPITYFSVFRQVMQSIPHPPPTAQGCYHVKGCIRRCVETEVLRKQFDPMPIQ